VRKGIIVLIFLLVVPIVFGQTQVSTSVIQNEIAVGEIAKYSLTLRNSFGTQQRYSIYSFQSGQGWNVEPSPLSDKIVVLGPGETRKVVMTAEPLEDFPPGIYNMPFTVENVDEGERFPLVMKVYLSPEKPVDYLPSIKVEIDLDEKIKPTEAVSVKLEIENRNPLNLMGMGVKIRSDVAEFAKEAIVDLPPLEKKTVGFTIIPDKFQQPKDYTLFFVFSHNGRDFKVIEKKIEVLTLLPSFEKEEVVETVFLKNFVQLNVVNKGNVKNTQEVKVPISFWEAIFTEGGDIRAIDGERYIIWELELGANKSETLNYVTDYRILLYLAILAMIFLGFYLKVRSPVMLSKKAVTTRSDEEGALSEIKITLEVRNKTKKVLHNVIIEDVVPAIANVQESLELGTLKPQEIKHTKQGTRVKWALAELDLLEHRLITYKVRAKLNILGVFKLPRATVTFAKGKRKKKAYSNISRLGQFK
jgi:hypothetical protein